MTTAADGTASTVLNSNVGSDDAAVFTGNVTGNVTGDVTGNLTGNATGDIMGDVKTTADGTASTVLNPMLQMTRLYLQKCDGKWTGM